MSAANVQYPDVQLLINGRWQDAAEGDHMPVLNPATGATIGQHAHAKKADLDAALEAARDGFDTWKNVPAMERAKVLRKTAALLRERADRIARIITLEQGKPLAEAKGETLGAVGTIEWAAGEAERIYGRYISARKADVQQLVIRQPVGPVAAFTPWNFPLNQAVRKVSMALAAGCSVILKGPEDTPASVAELMRCYVDAGVSAGAVNLVYGIPGEISDYLIRSPIIRKISFTGSTAVGKQLAALAGEHMKLATMELGGHAPTIVCDDAAIDSTLDLVTASKFRNAGQVCVSPTRFLVQEGIFDEFVDKFTARARALNVGDGLQDGVQMGPLAHDRRPSAVASIVDDAVKQGAQLHLGGHIREGGGYFYEPTVLTNLNTDMRIMNDEPFGPVAAFIPFKDLDEAISEANRLPYGLAAYAFTSSMRSAHRLGHEIESGMVSINHFGLALPETPFGGVKDSGYGSEGGSEAIEAYLQSHFITTAMI